MFRWFLLAHLLLSPLVAQDDFRAVCLRGVESEILAAGLRNPSLALREYSLYIDGPDGSALVERFIRAAPDEAVGMASGPSKSAAAFRELLSMHAPELASIATDGSLDLPLRTRAAFLAGRLLRPAAIAAAHDTARFFAAVLDLRVGSAADEAAAYDRALENEALLLCRAAQENLGRTLSTDLARFRARDLYALLTLGRAEATPPIFKAIYDRLLAPKWQSEVPRAASLTRLLDATDNWRVRDFATAALDAHRFDSLLALAGRDLTERLVLRLERAADPLREAMRLAELVDAAAESAVVPQFRSAVAAEFERCRAAGDARGTTLYGMLAARLQIEGIAEPYAPYLRGSETLDTATLFGSRNLAVQRHFFWDDEDGVQSFESFVATYRGDPAWEITETPDYVRITGRGTSGRTIEIYANIPIDGHLPRNRPREGEAQRRQRAIANALDARGLVPTVYVHRGHSFWAEKTLSYMAPPARLVILGSCGGATEIYKVIDTAHDAQVIATRGVGETEINDSILKAINSRMLNGDSVIHWDTFWKELRAKWGNNALFRSYLAPNQDPGTVFLRAYWRYMDAGSR